MAWRRESGSNRMLAGLLVVALGVGVAGTAGAQDGPLLAGPVRLGLPTACTVTVDGDDGTHTDVTVRVGVGGGRGSPSQTLAGLPIGTVCTVAEQDTDALPPGTEVRDEPASAPTTGVTVGAGTDVVVTLPGAGGPGAPTLTVRVSSVCAVEERASTVPPGWTDSYSVTGGASTTGPTPFFVPDDTVSEATVTGGGDAELARTGGPGIALPLTIGLALLVAGALVVRATRPSVTITKRSR